MKQVLLPLTILAALSTSALADSFGVRLGYPLGVQYTAENSFGKNRDLRIGAAVSSSSFLGFSNYIGLQADYLQVRPSDSSKNLDFYYGGGANVQVSTGYSYTSISPGVQGTGGLEFHFDKSISVFFDGSVGLNFDFSPYGRSLYPNFNAALGFNFKL